MRYRDWLSPATSVVNLLLLLSACSTPFGSFDNEGALLVQSVTLFAQQDEPRSDAYQPWAGNWIFRRKRLELIDLDLRRE